MIKFKSNHFRHCESGIASILLSSLAQHFRKRSRIRNHNWKYQQLNNKMNYADDDDDDSDIEAALNKAHQKHLSGGLRASTSSKHHCPTNNDDDDDDYSEDEDVVCKPIASSCSSDDDESSCESSSYLTNNRNNKKKGMTCTDQKMKKLNKLSRNKTQNVLLKQQKPKKKLLDILYCSSTDDDDEAENDHNDKMGKDDGSESEDCSIDIKNGKENDNDSVEVIDITNDKVQNTNCHRRVTRRMLKENNNQQGVEMKTHNPVKTKKQRVMLPKQEVGDIERDAMLLLESSSDEKDNDCQQLNRAAASKRGRKTTGKRRNNNKKAALQKSILELVHNNDKIDVHTKLLICEAKMKLMENMYDDDDEKISICEATKISIFEAKKNLTEKINYDDENQLSQCSEVVIDEQHHGIQVKVYVKFINSFDGTTSNGNDNNNNNCSIITINSPDQTTVQMLIRSLLTIHKLKSSQVSVGCSYNGKVLNEYQPLSFYGITNNNSEIQATIFTSGNIGSSNNNMSSSNNNNVAVIGKKIQLSLQVNEYNKNHNEKIKITIGMKQSIQILIDTYCIMKSIDINNTSMKFTLKFDGEILDCTKTPNHYDIEHDDQIDFIIM